MQDEHGASRRNRIHAKHAGCAGSSPVAQQQDATHQGAHQAGAQRQFVPLSHYARHLVLAKAAAERQAERIDDQVGQDGASQGPVERAREPGKSDPASDGRQQAQDNPARLRQHEVDEHEHPASRIDRKAALGAGGEVIRVVVQGKEHVGGPHRDR